ALYRLPVLLLSRPPPAPPLFPYTTLFRSKPSAAGAGADKPRPGALPAHMQPKQERRDSTTRTHCVHYLALIERGRPIAFAFLDKDRKSTRLNSQSRENLVCRLLLEKKNKN